MIEDFLEFYFSAKRYKGLADSPVDTRVLNGSIKKIHKTIEDLSDVGIESKGIDKDDILKRIAKDYSDGKKAEETRYNHIELKCLSYNLGNNPELGFLDYCIELLSNSWRESFLRGVLHSLMIHWTDFDDAGRQRVCDFFKKRVLESSSRYATSIKEYIKYLDRGGSYKLGNHTRTEKKDISEVCHVFGLSTNRISYSYFSDAIVAYYESIENDEFAQLKQILKQHNNIRTSKIVVSKMIIRYQDDKSLEKQMMDFAVEMIGDPTIESKWAPFPNATREEEKNLEIARKILLRLYAERAIDTFFKYLCTDERRRKFWKRFSKKIDNFVVYGPAESKNYIAPYINYNFLIQHYKQVNSTKSTCGLVMYMRDFVIIEFSDTGALYVYKKGDYCYNNVFSSPNSINKIDDLKLPYLSNLVTTEGDYMYFSDEGRLIHSGHWERRMGAWIERLIK